MLTFFACSRVTSEVSPPQILCITFFAVTRESNTRDIAHRWRFQSSMAIKGRVNNQYLYEYICTCIYESFKCLLLYDHDFLLLYMHMYEQTRVLFHPFTLCKTYKPKSSAISKSFDSDETPSNSILFFPETWSS